MSQKSTARTGSEGDVEIKEIANINARSASSSGKTKRDIFGGPFGDSPFDRVQDAYQDYLFIMFHNQDETPVTSDSSQADHDLYNLRYNYTEQLNLVRKKLNLVELSEDDHQRCTITEVTEEESNQELTVKEGNSSPYQNLGSNEIKFNELRKGYELTTIHPFSVTYNLESGSSTNILESDYSPPTKKVCQRLQTPRFASMSEGNVPGYSHTKINVSSLGEGVSGIQNQGKSFVKDAVKQFTETRETQCNEEEFTRIKLSKSKATVKDSIIPQCSRDKVTALDLSFESETETETDSPRSGTLFPKVIIKNNEEEESSLSIHSSRRYLSSTTTSSSKDSIRKASEVLSLNSVRGSSDEEASPPVKMTSTTIDSSWKKKCKSRKDILKRQKASLERLTMWEEVTRLRSGTDDNKVSKLGDGDSPLTGDTSYDYNKIDKYVNELSQNIKLRELLRNETQKNCQTDGKSKLNQYIRQYIDYKSEVEKVKIASGKKYNKHTIIGQKLVNIQNRIMDSPDKLYQSENSLVSDEENRGKVTPSVEESSNCEDKTRFWERFCNCLCPFRSFSA